MEFNDIQAVFTTPGFQQYTSILLYFKVLHQTGVDFDAASGSGGHVSRRDSRAPEPYP
ncbi:MAG: hypothetical protein K9L23_21760 [Desulfotignum sp.]|nr:hypothetical protein [Desulfotignum sp.]